MNLTRTVIVGTSCSGKTTFARTLAARLQVPHIELDAIHWQANWTPLETQLFGERVAEAVAPERWVVDGNYSKVRDRLWPRATTIIWLNYAFPIVWGRALRRTLRRLITRDELWAGNRESFRMSFLSRDSILWWVLTTHRRRQREYPQLFERPENRHLEVIVLDSPRKAEQFLQTLPKSVTAQS